jgi:hypothetical protein
VYVSKLKVIFFSKKKISHLMSQIRRKGDYMLVDEAMAVYGTGAYFVMKSGRKRDLEKQVEGYSMS